MHSLIINVVIFIILFYDTYYNGDYFMAVLEDNESLSVSNGLLKSVCHLLS